MPCGERIWWSELKTGCQGHPHGVGKRRCTRSTIPDIARPGAASFSRRPRRARCPQPPPTADRPSRPRPRLGEGRGAESERGVRWEAGWGEGEERRGTGKGSGLRTIPSTAAQNSAAICTKQPKLQTARKGIRNGVDALRPIRERTTTQPRKRSQRAAAHDTL